MAGNIVVGILRALLTADSAEYSEGLRQAASQTTDFAKGMKSVGKQMQDVGMAVMPVSLAIAGIGTAAVAVGVDFERSMNAIQGVLRPTSDEIDRVRQLAMQLGADTAFSAKDAADAMLELGKAGFTVGQSMEAVDDVLQLAAASGLSMGAAAEMAARTLNAFGLKTEDLAHVNDVLAKAVNESTLEIEDLQTAFGYVGPIAKGFGMSIEQTSAALALMRDNGIAAETAGRALREGLTRLANPVKSVTEVMEDLGIKSFENHGKLMNLSEIVEVLRGKNITAAQALKLFGDAAGPGMYALIQQGRPALDGLTESLKNSDGAAKAMADAMMAGLPGAFEKMRGSVETALLSISKGLEPSLLRVLDLIGSLADFITTRVMPAFESLSPGMQTTIVVVAGIAAALGPALVAFGAFVAAVGAAIPVLAAFWAALTGPIGLTVAAIAALSAAWYVWGDDIKAICSDVLSAIQNFFVDKFNAIVANIKAKIDAVVGWFKWMYDATVGHSYVPDMINGIGQQFDLLEPYMVKKAKSAADLTVKEFSNLAKHVNTYMGMFATAVDVHTQHVSEQVDLTASHVDTAMAMMAQAARVNADVIQASSNITRDSLLMIATTAQVTSQDVVNTVSVTLNAFDHLKNGVLDSLGDLWAGMSGSNGFAGLMENLGHGIVQGFGNILSGGLSQVINMGVQLAIEGVKKIGGLIGGLFKSEESKHVNEPRDQFFEQYGGYEGLAEKLTSAFEKRGDTNAGGAADELITNLYNAKDKGSFNSAQRAITELIGGNVFASGTPGLAPLDFGTETLALLHGREAVIPESRMGEFAAQHGPDQTINVYLDSVLVTQRVVRNMPRVLALHGVG